MMISSTFRHRVMQASDTTKAPVLNHGQIVQGKILKLHPNNRAEIQIGKQQLTAEITTSLSVGRQYYFQVQADDQYVQLKVIGDYLKQDRKANIAQLIHQLGLKASKTNIEMVHYLMNKNAPFHPQAIQEAMQIMEKTSYKVEGMQILKEMLETNTPVTNSVFQALLATKLQRITPLLQEMQKELIAIPSQTKVEQALLQKIEQIMKRPLSVQQKLIGEMLRPETPILPLLELAGVFSSIPQEKDLLQYNLQDSNKGFLAPILNRNASSQEQIARIVYEGNTPSLAQLMRNILNEPHMTEKEIDAQFKQIQDTLYAIVRQEGTIQPLANQMLTMLQTYVKDQDFTLIRNLIQEQLLPLLPTNMKQVITPLLLDDKEVSQQLLRSHLETLANQEIYKLIGMITKEKAEDKAWPQLSLQQQFLSHVREVIQVIGLKDEFILKNSVQETLSPQAIDRTSIKSLLLELSHTSHSISPERIQQMLHFINGLQLQSVQESNQFIHAAIQVPGEKLGLNQEIYMQFEGKKTENNKIDPDYCRILFVLHLEKINETIIDMHLQKRIISLTLYNEKESLQKWINLLKKPLEKKLQAMDYQISSITLKPLYKREASKKSHVVLQEANSSTERFDFRI